MQSAHSIKPVVLAFAALAAGSAAAQSSVTLFGVIDAGVSHYSTRSARFSCGVSST